MNKCFRARPWLVVLTVAAVATPALAVGVALAAGPPDPNDYVRSVEYVHAVSSSAKTATKSVTALCPAPKQVLGGGANVSVATSVVRTSTPLTGGTGWTASATGLPIRAWTLDVWAICADVHGTGPSSDQTSGGTSGNTSGGTSGQHVGWDVGQHLGWYVGQHLGW